MNSISFEHYSSIPSEGHSSKGNQPKWERRGSWYKADHMGYEALAEVLISTLLKDSNVSDFVAYDPVLIQYDGKSVSGCSSKSFRKEGEILISFERLYRSYRGKSLAHELARMDTREKIRYTVDFVESVTGLRGVGAYLTMILELDAVFLNEDRHTNNLSVIRDETTGRYRLCPIYDNGLSLLSDLNDYPLGMDFYALIAKVRAKPFDREFDLQAEAAELLYHPQLRLRFNRQRVAEELSALRDYYPDEILSRAGNVLFEQMRKYSFFFR